MFNKKLSSEDKLNLIGLESLDDIDKDAIIEMFENSWSGKTLYGNPSTNTLSSSAAMIYSSASTAAISTQNLMILKQILQLKENQYKQNQEIIDLLKQLVMQNQQPIQTRSTEQYKNVSQSTLEELQKLEELISLNILTQEEFDKKKKELLNR